MTESAKLKILNAITPLALSGAGCEAAFGRPLLFNPMKTFVYVDGFNLYYRAVKRTPFKWLDIHQLCRLLLPKAQVARINYYTARVTARPHDPDQPTRQNVYLRALKTIPCLEIVEGSFLTKPATLPLASDPTTFATVIKTEEKGSDVNLATHLVNDGHLHRYEQAVVITNDSDLAEPVRVVRDELKLPIGILYPSKYLNPQLKNAATPNFTKPIRRGLLSASQFPDVLSDRIGSFHKPEGW